MHIIQTSTPSVPEGFTVAYHNDMGPFDIEKLEQWLEENSTSSKLPWPEPETCADVREYAERATGIINACILDYALAHPELMPILWDLGNPVAAYGTVYADADGALHVKVIEYRGGGIPPEGRMDPICWTEPTYEHVWEPGKIPSNVPLYYLMDRARKAAKLSRIQTGSRLVSGWEARFHKPSPRHIQRCGVW